MSVTEMNPAQAPPGDRSRWIALIVLCVGMLMIVLDQTIVNVALPSIQRDLKFSTSSLAWVVNAYLIAFGGLLLLAGRLGDLVGRKRVFLTGLAIFTAASALCGLADSQGLLVGARFVQGIGGALSSAVILAMIVRMFQTPAEQAKAIGVYGFVASAGGSIGLLLGGVLTQAISWHFIFVINLPIGVLVGWLALRLVDNPDGLGMQEGADFPGAALITGALMLGVFTILQITTWGWVDPRTIGGLVLAAVTSLPNAVVAIYLALRGRGAATLSTAMNSNALNVAIGLLVPGTILGLGAPSGQATLIAGWYLGLTGVSLACAFAGHGLRRGHGVLIIILYLAFAAAVLRL